MIRHPPTPEAARCACRGECGKVHTSGQCRSEKGKHVEDARHPTILRDLNGKRYCQSCHGRLIDARDSV